VPLRACGELEARVAVSVQWEGLRWVLGVLRGWVAADLDCLWQLELSGRCRSLCCGTDRSQEASFTLYGTLVLMPVRAGALGLGPFFAAQTDTGCIPYTADTCLGKERNTIQAQSHFWHNSTPTESHFHSS